jgi:nucleotide-binding universal stress UspA family protein
MAADDPVMVATDLSARSDRPFERAFLLAKQLDAPLLVLHVLERKKDLEQEKRERLLRLIEEEFGANAQNAEILLEPGEVPETIARVAHERNCALIITGVARFNSPADYVLGTAVDHLVRQSRTPVLVVKRRPRKPYRRLLAGTDFSSGSMHALVKAAQLFPDAELRLIHVYRSAYDAFLAHDTTADYIRDEAQTSMRAFTDALPKSVRSRLETAVTEGHLAGVIEDEISNLRADLLVLGTHGRSGFAQATVGSQAADLLEYEPVDVFVTRPPKRDG